MPGLHTRIGTVQLIAARVNASADFATGAHTNEAASVSWALICVYMQVVENDRRASAAVGKDYASRPTSYKGSLSLKPDR